MAFRKFEESSIFKNCPCNVNRAEKEEMDDCLKEENF